MSIAFPIPILTTAHCSPQHARATPIPDTLSIGHPAGNSRLPDLIDHSRRQRPAYMIHAQIEQRRDQLEPNRKGTKPKTDIRPKV